MCAGVMNAPVSLRIYCIAAMPLGCLWSGYHDWYYINKTPAFPSKEPYTKCILGYSALVNHTI
jgi:hypothetical protein